MKVKPSEMYSEPFKQRLEEAMELCRQEKYDQLLAECEFLLEEEPDCQVPMVLIAKALWKLQLYQWGIAFCESRLLSYPRNEFLSVTLFEMLLETGREGDARREMERFLSMAKSEAYLQNMKRLGWDRDAGGA